MKPILMNGITLANREIFGIQRNTMELLCELDKLLEPGELTLVIPEQSERELSFDHIELLRVPVDSHSPAALRKWSISGFNALLKSRGAIGADMILSLPLGGCELVTVYDCITEMFPGNADTLRKRLARRFYMLRAASCLRRARVVTTDSESARRDLVRIYGIDESKIHVIYCAWQHFERVKPDESVLDRLGLRSRRYFFALGSRYYHKNTRWLAAAARQNPRDLFVVSGSSLSGSDPALEDAPENLLYAGYLSDGEVKALMSRCAAFLQPSLYEGFGIPPMEAMSAGARCIVSDIPALREVYGEAVWYVDPLDYAHIDLDEIMRRPVADSRTVLDAYSWEKSARQLKELLDGLLRGDGSGERRGAP